MTDFADAFLVPKSTTHRQYEALGAFYVERSRSVSRNVPITLFSWRQGLTKLMSPLNGGNKNGCVLFLAKHGVNS
jgi:hypothetical protein